MRIPLDNKVKELSDLPYTISFVIKKRQQIDSLRELPKEKQPTDEMIWDGTTEEIEEWLDKVFNRKEKETVDFNIDVSDIES